MLDLNNLTPEQYRACYVAPQAQARSRAAAAEPVAVFAGIPAAMFISVCRAAAP
jgi:hypothetical protein